MKLDEVLKVARSMRTNYIIVGKSGDVIGLSIKDNVLMIYLKEQ